MSKWKNTRDRKGEVKTVRCGRIIDPFSVRTKLK